MLHRLRPRIPPDDDILVARSTQDVKRAVSRVLRIVRRRLAPDDPLRIRIEGRLYRVRVSMDRVVRCGTARRLSVATESLGVIRTCVDALMR